ncbi:MAG TPA: hypothetical protein VM284_05770 [Candidatus Limnocylindria bacterium]|nr:hypothetical protein [Candidatus Limnocylindria bacterium]
MSQPQPAAAMLPFRRLNVPFLGALAIVIGLYALAFVLLNALIPVEQMAGTLAALVLGGGAYVQRYIERRLQVAPGPVPTRAGYEKPWLVLFVISAVAIWLAQSALPYLQLRVGPMAGVVSSVDSLLRLLAPATALVVGVVVAQRSDRWPLLVTLLAVVAGWLLEGITHGLVIGFATGTDGPPMAPPGVEMPPSPIDVYFGGGLLGYLVTSQLPLLIGAAMLGHWYGTRTRLQAYLGGLLREVRVEDRDTIVDMAYDAARSRNIAEDQRSSGS